MPDAPVITQVDTVSNSSVKVTWSAPNANNDTIMYYELGYRLADHVSWSGPVETATAATSHTLAGLDPGTYEVRVRAVNSVVDLLDARGNMIKAPWSAIAMGSTGTGAQTPTLTLAVGSALPEGQATIPVTVTATVEPSAVPERTLSVQLKLLGQKTPNPETDAEFSTEKVTVSNPDVSWDSVPASDPVLSSAVVFTFTSNLSSEQTIYLTTGSDMDAENENFRITATSAAMPNVFSKVAAAGTTAGYG